MAGLDSAWAIFKEFIIIIINPNHVRAKRNQGQDINVISSLYSKNILSYSCKRF